MTDAIFYRSQYLLPEGYSDWNSFSAAMKDARFPWTIRAEILREDYKVKTGAYEQGVSIAPYFISGYGKILQDVVIESAAEVYPVQVERLPQSEYNQRLRELVCAYCPGCRNFGSVNEKDSSLSGHFDEISLDGVCFYRYETRLRPNVFHETMHELIRWKTPKELRKEHADWMRNEFEFWAKIKYAAAEITDDGDARTLTFTAKKPDLFLTLVTDVIAKYIRGKLDENYFIALSNRVEPDEAAISAMLAPKKIKSLRKELKKYGLSIAVLEYAPKSDSAVLSAMQPAEAEWMALPLYGEPGRRVWLFTAPAKMLMHLRYHAPLLESENVRAVVYAPDKTTIYRISFDMVVEAEELAPVEPPKESKPPKLTKKQLKAEEGKLLNHAMVEDLFSYLEIKLAAGCDGTNRFTAQWVREHMPDQYDAVLAELLDMGGFCDCEVLLNCYPDYEN